VLYTFSPDMTIFLTVSFFSALLFFGWQTARWVLREHRIEHLIALGGIFGIGLYTFCVNIAGLFLPIAATVYFVLAVFLLVAFGLYLHRRFERGGVEKPWRTAVLLFALFVTFSVGFMFFRHPMDDTIFRAPTAATMVEGNFPPVQIWNPTSPFSYHYAPDLFAAATVKVTGVPLYVAYDLQRALLSGCLFLLTLVLVLAWFPRKFFAAAVSALSMLYAGSIDFFNVFNGVPTLYSKFVLGEKIPGAFKFVSDAIVGEYTAPVINSLALQHWGAMAFSLMVAVLYLYFYLWNAERNRAGAFLVGGFLLALLALVSEPYFAVFCTAIFAFPLVRYLFGRDLLRAKKLLTASFLLLLVTVPATFVQGGFVRTAVVEQFHLDLGASSSETPLFITNETGARLFHITTPEILRDSYGIRFVREVGLLLVVLVPALVFLLRRRFEEALFLSGVLALCLVPPLLIASDADHITTLLWRFFFPLNLIGGIVVGVFLAFKYEEARTLLVKAAVGCLAIALMAQGVWTHAVWLAFGNPPGGPLNPNAQFFAEEGSVEAASYNWIKRKTTIKDLFFIVKDDYKQCGFASAPNCLFIYNTGRMAPTYEWLSAGGGAKAETTAPEKAALFHQASRTCDASILETLGYTYLYVDGLWPAGLEQRCLESNRLELIFSEHDENAFVRIYRIIR